MKKKLCATLLLFVLSLCGYSQHQTASNDSFLIKYKQAYKPKTQITLSASPVFYNSIQIEHIGAQWLQSNPAFGGTIGVGVYQKLFKGLGVMGSANAGTLAYNMRYQFTSTVNHPDVSFNQHFIANTDFIPYANLSLGLVYRCKAILKKQRIAPLLGVGIFRNTISTYSGSGEATIYIDEQQPSLDVFEVTYQDINNSNTPYFSLFSYYAKLGVITQNKKFNTCSFNLVYNFTPQTIAYGQFQFFNLAEESKGNLTFGMNYVGVEFVYGMTFNKPK